MLPTTPPRASQVLPAGRQWAFEFRDASWFCQEVYGVLRENNWCLVMPVMTGARSWGGALPLPGVGLSASHSSAAACSPCPRPCPPVAPTAQTPPAAAAWSRAAGSAAWRPGPTRRRSGTHWTAAAPWPMFASTAPLARRAGGAQPGRQAGTGWGLQEETSALPAAPAAVAQRSSRPLPPPGALQYQGAYGAAEMRKWAGWAKQWSAQGRQASCLSCLHDDALGIPTAAPVLTAGNQRCAAFLPGRCGLPSTTTRCSPAAAPCPPPSLIAATSQRSCATRACGRPPERCAPAQRQRCCPGFIHMRACMQGAQ